MIESLDPEPAGEGPEAKPFFESQPADKSPLGNPVRQTEPSPPEPAARGRGVLVEKKRLESGRHAQADEIPGPAENPRPPAPDPVRVEKQKPESASGRSGRGRFVFKDEDVAVGKIAMDDPPVVQAGENRGQRGKQAA